MLDIEQVVEQEQMAAVARGELPDKPSVLNQLEHRLDTSAADAKFLKELKTRSTDDLKRTLNNLRTGTWNSKLVDGGKQSEAHCRRIEDEIQRRERGQKWIDTVS